MKQDIEIIPVLPIYQYQLQFKVDDAIRLPRFSGSAWRGAFGHALKKTVCVVRDTPCPDCLLKTSCAYSYIFETPPPPQAVKMRKYNAAPHPFVLQLPLKQNHEAKKYLINIIIYGHGQRFFPYIIHAMQKTGQDGLGASRQVFELENITQITTVKEEHIVFQHGKIQNQATDQAIIIPPMPKEIKLTFHTPVRIKQQGHILDPGHFVFGAFFGNLLRRISMLTYFHTDTPLETNFAALTHQARQINFSDKKLHWYEWKRYSSRQKTEMNMGGVRGTLQLDSNKMEQFWPYLWLGQWTHVGKATSMGMGHYSIDMTSLPEKSQV